MELSDDTAAVVLALSAISDHDRVGFLQSVKPFKFNLGSIEQKFKAEQKKAEKAAAAPKPASKKKGKVA